MNGQNKHIILVFVLIYFICIESRAQTSRFNGGIVAGLNFAELEGNGTTDYFGLNAGILGTAKLSKHSQLSMEFLFSQNGEYVLPEYYPALQYGQVWLNHIEVPIHPPACTPSILWVSHQPLKTPSRHSLIRSSPYRGFQV